MQIVYALRPFDADSQEYREARAVETFNAAAQVMKEYKRLHPNAQSACPHVALCILPRQQVQALPELLPSSTCIMWVVCCVASDICDACVCTVQVAYGDHHRRGADHSESFGASMKDTIHRRTLRRRIGTRDTVHEPCETKEGWQHREDSYTASSSSIKDHAGLSQRCNHGTYRS